MVCPRLAISFSYLPDFPHKAQVYPEHRFSERYSSLSNKPRYMFNNTISQLNAEQWSRTYTLWLPWHQLIHCYLDNCKFLYTYQLACTLTTELLLPCFHLSLQKCFQWYILRMHQRYHGVVRWTIQLNTTFRKQ